MSQHQYSYQISTQYTEMDQKSIVDQLVEQFRQTIQEQGLSASQRLEIAQRLQHDGNQAPNQNLSQNNSSNQLQLEQKQIVQAQIPPLELKQAQSMEGSILQQFNELSDPMKSSSKKSENFPVEGMDTGRYANELKHPVMIPGHKAHAQQNQVRADPQNQNQQQYFVQTIQYNCCKQQNECRCKKEQQQ